MSGAERAACKAMGRECCGTKGGQVSHAPVASALLLAAAPVALAFAVLAAEMAAFSDPLRVLLAAPAILQGVGLFTLFDVSCRGLRSAVLMLGGMVSSHVPSS